MTNDIEGKIKKILLTHLYSNFPEENYDNAVRAILSLTTKAELLNENKIVLNGHIEKGSEDSFWRTVHLPNSGSIIEINKKDICSHFSKPKVKYPKYEFCTKEGHIKNTGSLCTECVHKHYINYIIDKMRQLNKEDVR